MNIQGLPNYSKETVGLRQKEPVLDQQFKLIYVYPMLFEQLTTPQQQELLRRFLSSSHLREIIVSNSLNIISVASRIQAQPSNDVAQLIGRAIISGSGGSTPPSSTIPQNTSSQPYSYDYQRQVEQKTEIIKKYLNTDARTKKLLPHVELITLNNLIDVPVVVGTKPYNMNSLLMLYVLSVALVRNITLDSISNVQAILRLLKSTNDSSWFNLLSYTAETNRPWRERWAESLRQRIPRLSTRRWINALINRLEGPNPTSNRQQQRTITTLQPTDPQPVPVRTRPQQTLDLVRPGVRDYQENQQASTHIFDIIKQLKTQEIDVLERNFRFILDPVALRSQTGIDASNNTLETTITRVSPRQTQILHQLVDKFIELSSTSGSLLLSSTTNILHPSVGSASQNRPTNLNVNFLELLDKHIGTDLNNAMTGIVLDTLRTELTSSLANLSPKESYTRIKLVKSLCSSMDQVDNLLTTQINKLTTSTISSSSFHEYEFESFVKNSYSVASTLSSFNQRFERSISQILNRGNVFFGIVKPVIYKSIEGFIREITNRPNYYPNLSNITGISPDRVRSTFIPQITDMIFSVFYFFFLYRLQSAICEYMDVLDIEVEASVNDALDFPNYCLVIPVEIILAMYTASVTNNINDLFRGSGNIRELQTFNDNYVKGMINQICRRLKLPSLIVIDSKSNSVFYKFMFMSSAEKMNFQTMNSFVNSSLR